MVNYLFNDLKDDEFGKNAYKREIIRLNDEIGTTLNKCLCS